MELSENMTAKQQKNNTAMEIDQQFCMLNTIFNECDDAIFMKDMNGIYTKVNTVAAGILGRKPDELIGCEDKDFFDSSTVDRLKKLDKKIFESGENVNIELELKTISSVNISCNSKRGPLLDTKGNICGIFSISRNPTFNREYQGDLKSVEQNLDLTLAAANAGTWELDLVTGEVVYSEDWSSSKDYYESGIVNKYDAWLAQIHTGDVDKVLAVWNDFIEGKSLFFECEYRLRTKSGEWIWVLDRAQISERDIDNKPLKVKGVHLDTSKSKQTEAQLQQFKEIISASDDSIIVIDEQYHIVFVNQIWLDFTKKSFSEVINKPAIEVLGESLFEKYRPHLEITNTKGLYKTEFELKDSEENFSRKSYNYRRFWSVNDSSWHILITSRDITTLTATERKLQEKNALLEAIIEGTSDAIYVKDKNGRYLMMNQQGARMLNKEVEDIIGHFDAEIFPSLNVETIAIEDKNIFEKGELISTEEKVISETGAALYLHTLKGPVKDADKRITGSFGISRNVTEQKITDIKLKESESRFRSAFNNTLTAMGINAIDGSYLDVNKAMCDFTGYSKEELLKMKFSDITHPEDKNIDEGKVEQLITGEIDSFSIEKRYIHKSGKVIWALLDISIVRDEENMPQCYVGHRQDITLQKETEVQLKEQVNLLKAIMDGASDSIFVKDINGYYLAINPVAASLLDKTVEEVIGKHDHDLFPADSALNIVNDDLNVLKTMQDLKAEEVITGNSGEIIYLDTHKSALIDASGVVKGTIGVSRDITLQKKSDEIIKTSEERFRVAFDYAAFPMCIADTGGAFVRVNKAYCELLGYSEEEILSMDYTQITHKDDLAEEYLLFEAILKGRSEGYTMEKRYVSKSGDIVWISLGTQMARDDFGNPTQLLVQAFNITARKKAEENLKNAHQRLRYHVENTPLAVIELDRELTMMNWSKNAENIFGWKEEEMLNKSMTEVNIVYEDDQLETIESMQSLLDGSSSNNSHRNRNYTKSGKIIHCDWYNSALYDENGKLLSILALAHDVTEAHEAETRIQSQHFLLQTITEGINDSVYVKDTEGRYLLMNSKGAEYIGKTVEQIEGKVDADIFPTVIAKKIVNQDKDVISAGELMDFESQSVYGENDIRYLHTVKGPFRNSDGEITGTFGITSDITEKYLSKKKLEVSEENFRIAFEGAPVAMAITDMEGNFIRVNSANCALLGYSENELLEMDVVQISHPDDIEKEMTEFAKLVSGETDSYAMEKRYVVRSGEIKWAAMSVAIVRDHDGKPSQLLGQSIDISDRKRAEEALYKSEQRLTLAQEAANIATWEWDILSDRITTSANHDAMLTGDIVNEVLIENDWQSLIHPEDRDAAILPRTKAMEDPENPVFFQTYRVIWADDSVHWIAGRGRAFFNEDGEAIRLLGVNIDISELKIAEDNSTFGTPLKISKKVFSSKDAKSFEVDFPNNMFEAKIAFSKSLVE